MLARFPDSSAKPLFHGQVAPNSRCKVVESCDLKQYVCQLSTREAQRFYLTGAAATLAYLMPSRTSTSSRSSSALRGVPGAASGSGV